MWCCIKKYRTHQHKEYLSVEDTIPDVQEAINAEQISESQYNSEAVDIEKLKTHLPVVKIETSEEIPGVPYYEEGYSHRKYTTTSEGVTISRTELKKTEPSARLLEAVYSFAFDKNIKINKLKEMFWRDDLGANEKLLFHGAKTEIDGEIDIRKWKKAD